MDKELFREMLKEFLYAFCINGKFNLHINNHYGENDHHKIEALFKALERRFEFDDIMDTHGTAYSELSKK